MLLRLTCGRSVVLASMLALGAVWTGCASEDAPDPNGDTQTPSHQTTTSQEKNQPAPENRPNFDANFPDPKKDPAPPNANQCVDNDDSGSTETVAKVLPPTDDCDNEYKELNGVANGPADVDFYKLETTDKTGCWLNTDFELPTSGLELCVYARCKNSTADAVTGCTQGVLTKSDIGMQGCCSATPGRAVPEWDCSGWTDDDSADFFLRVRGPQLAANACTPYKVRYQY